MVKPEWMGACLGAGAGVGAAMGAGAVTGAALAGIGDAGGGGTGGAGTAGGGAGGAGAAMGLAMACSSKVMRCGTGRAAAHWAHTVASRAFAALQTGQRRLMFQLG